MRGLIFLVGLAAVLYIFNPSAGIIANNPSAEADGAKVLNIFIKDRAIADPAAADLKAKLGEKTILQVTTDEDGRVDLKNAERGIFNPVFSGTINSISIPTDKETSFTIEFQPQEKTNVESARFPIVTVVIRP